jgi:hypothetical protein
VSRAAREVILNHLIDVAERCAPCPTNDALCALVGWQSTSAASVALSQMESEGLIAIERGQNSRIVTIIATGKRTSGEVPRPHWRRMTPEQRAECAERYKSPPKPKPNLRANKKEFEVERALNRMAEKERTDRDAAANYAQRDPCVRCGVRRDRHDEFGCGRYRV